jgi:phosphatidate cytidylyltransferase
MKRILTALVLIPLVLLLVFKAPFAVIALTVCAVAILAIHEYLHIASHYGAEPFRWLTYGLTVALFAAAFYAAVPPKQYLVVAVLSLALFLNLIAAMRSDSLKQGFTSAALSYFGLPYIGLSLATLLWIRAQNDGVFWLVVLFATVWAGDSVAMYVGKSLGRHKLAPRVSPNKTWEGSFGSLLGSLAFSLVALHFRWQIISADGLLKRSRGADSWQAFVPARPHLGAFILLVIVLNIAAQFGDLVESVIKRGADVKDSGSLLPGHGGILDRIDALLFAAPVLWYYLAIIRS